MFPRIAIATVVLLLALSINLSVAALPSTSNNGRTTLNGSAPSWASSNNYRSAADPTSYVGFRVYLGWNNPSNVEALAQAVSDPKSSSYGQYLTPSQFHQQFAPSQSQVGAVQSWLRSQGFSVEYTPSNNLYVSAEGTVAQAQSAFGTSFGLYTVSGLVVRPPSTDVSIPSSLAGVVTGVLRFVDSVPLVFTDHSVGYLPPPRSFVSSIPAST